MIGHAGDRGDARAGRPRVLHRRALASVKVLVLVLVAVVPVRGGEGDLSPDAGEVLEAVRAKDGDRLAGLAEEAERGFWEIVDDLLAAGCVEEARAFARATGDEALARYAADPPGDDPEARAALRAALRAREAGSPEAALRALEGVEAPAATILACRIAAIRTGCLIETGRRSESGPCAAAVREAAAAVGRDLEAERLLLGDRAVGLYDLGRYVPSLRASERLLGIARVLGHLFAEALAETNIGALFVHLDQPIDALDRLESAAGNLRSLEDAAAEPEEKFAYRVQRALLHLTHAQALTDLGEYARSLEVGSWCLEVLEGCADRSLSAYGLRVQGDTYVTLGDRETAVAHYERALRIPVAEDPGEVIERVALLLNRGKALQESGRLREGRESVLAALSLLGDHPHPDARAVALLNLGEILEKEGDWSGALESHERVLGLPGLSPVLRTWGLLRKADALIHRGRLDDPAAVRAADACLAEASATLPPFLDPGLGMLLDGAAAQVQLLMGHPRPALERATRALDTLEQMMEGLADGETVSARDDGDRRRLFALALRAARACDDPAAVFDVMERSRAQAFLAALGGRSAWQRRVAEGPVAEGLREWRTWVSARYLALVRAREDGDRRLVREKETALEEARELYAEQVRRLERGTRRSAGELGARPVTLAETRRGLGEGEILVEYAVTDREILALVLDGESLRLVDLGDPAEVLGGWREAVAADPRPSTEDLGKVADGLAARLLTPLKIPEGTKLVLLSPDGPLTGLPWPWLASRAGGTEIVLVPSATTWRALAGRKHAAGRGRIVLGNPLYRYEEGDARLAVHAGGRTLGPLPESEREARAIAAEGDVLLLGGDATEEKLLAALSTGGRRAVLHLAAHGVVGRGTASLSAVALTPAGGEDGFLTALEVYAASVPADLVVLSACDLAGDRTAAGEGLLGLTRAFLLAGADRVVASLWKVDDRATRAFMTAFHRELARPGATPASALAAAREEVRRHPPWTHPDYWAAWVLWGLP